MKLMAVFKWLLCLFFVVYLWTSAVSKIGALFIPNFEMTVSSEMAQVVKPYGALVRVSLSFVEHDLRDECGTDDVVVSLASEGFVSALASHVEYSCGNNYSESCPSMQVEYRDDTTVYVSGVLALRSVFPFGHLQECARNIISLGRSLKGYVEEGEYNKRTYDGL